jgi:hypothetical protein
VEASSYKGFLQKVREFLQNRRHSLGARVPEVVRESTGLALKGFKVSYQRLLILERMFEEEPLNMKTISEEVTGES